MTRILVLSDLHAGHQAGLTPPGYQNEKWLKMGTKAAHLYQVQRQCWDFFEHNVRKHGPYNVVVINGDAIDGRGERSGGVELITTDREQQCEMAVIAVRKALSKHTKVYMTYGTDYHTGQSEDFENIIANSLGAEAIQATLQLTIEGIVFDFRHHVGSSASPFGRATAVAKEQVWNVLKAARKEAAQAHIVVRSHVHYFAYSGNRDALALTTPALQAPGTRYGERRCSGTVDFGFVVFDVDKEHYTWQPVIATGIPSLQLKPIKVA